MTEIRYVIQKERQGYSVWTASWATGSKQDCLGHFVSKGAAKWFIVKERRRHE